MTSQGDNDGAREATRSGPDKVRRKINSAGIAGAGVLLSVASRSAMGGWGQCTGSELASGNLSRTGDPNPCGCSPGYWWNNNGEQSWIKYLASKYPPSATFNSVFGVTYFTGNVQLGQIKGGNFSLAFVPNCNANSLGNVPMHAVAALLNAEFYGNRYPVIGLQTGLAVIAAFQDAFNSPDRCSALTAFVTKVDVYTSQSTWCFGSPHGQ